MLFGIGYYENLFFFQVTWVPLGLFRSVESMYRYTFLSFEEVRSEMERQSRKVFAVWRPNIPSCES